MALHCVRLATHNRQASWLSIQSSGARLFGQAAHSSAEPPQARQ
ncbi:MAG: hypothetical protein PHV85_00110 [Desulfovibrionaceae bacterium]|nr:hypothetical protein [Desulfovibrionaceae bacterium]